MAESVLLLRIKWENQSHFEMESKRDDEAYIQTVRMEENGSLSSLWPHISNICKDFLVVQLLEIGEVMAQP